MDSAVATPTYFSLKDFLTQAEAATFFEWDHDRQVDKVAEYLDFVSAQPSAATFTSSRRVSTSWAETSNDVALGVAEDRERDIVLDDLLNGRAKSGFGAFASVEGYLPQRELSLAVARSIKTIGHEYVVERTKSGEIRPPVLNSRSFFLNWCHAEKQKLMDIVLKLDCHNPANGRKVYWDRLVIVVDRDMCADCVNYARNLATHEQAWIVIRDPSFVRSFPPSRTSDVLIWRVSS